MRNGQKVLILIGLVVVGLLVVTTLRNDGNHQDSIQYEPHEGGDQQHNQQHGSGGKQKPSTKPAKQQKPQPPKSPWNSKIDSFFQSIELHYPKYDPHKFKHNPVLSFTRYEYKDDKSAVFLTQPHYEWVTKYEAHVLPVFEDVAFHQPECLVIDVGANDGIYTQLSAGAGCKVVSFEMQDGCVEWIAASVLLNNVQDSVRIIPLPAYSEETTFTTKHVEGGCSGTYSLSPNSLNERPKGEDVEYKTIVIDKIVPNGLDITLLKVDVEGGDLGVISGAMHLFKQKRIKHLVAEIYAMMWPKPRSEEGLAVYHQILKAGYVAQCLGKYWLGNYPTEIVGDKPIFSYDQRKQFDDLVKAEKTCVDWHFYLPDDE